MMKNLSKHIEKALEETRLDEYLMALLRVVPWDDLMLAFSNICVFKANNKDIKQDGKEYRILMERGLHFHGAIIDKKTATVQKRKIKKEIENANKTAEN